MIKSLRVRFFLITWPLIVIALVAVALTFNRWADVQLTQALDARGSAFRELAHTSVDSVVQTWLNGAPDTSRLESSLLAALANDSLDAVVIDDHGRIVATTDKTLELEHVLRPALQPGPVSFVRTTRSGGMESRELIAVTGHTVADNSGTRRARTYLLPSVPARPPAVEAAALRADARRTMWRAVIIASAVAAVVALLLGGPLVGQIGRLATASSRVQAGDLATRVEAGRDDELGKLERAFNNMAASLERAEAHKRNLVHDVAHELRTPLTNIIGTLEAIEDGLRQPDDTTMATLRSEAGLLAALASDLQDLSMAESGQLRFELTDVDVAAEAIAANAAMRAGANGVVLEDPPAEPAFAIADTRRLRQVLRNLLSNAVAHTPSGGQVRVSIERCEGKVGVVVTDTGPGVPVEHLALIWDRFHRVDSARDRATGGRGLGLAIVKQFVEGMGGSVAVRNLERGGAEFSVWLDQGSRSIQSRA